MRILVTATTFPRWKNDTEPAFVYFLSKLLQKKGHDIVMLVPHHPGARRFEVMDGMKVYRFPYFIEKHQKLYYDGGIIPNMKKYPYAKFLVPGLVASELFFMARLVKKEKIDIIHAHWIIPQGFTAALLKRFLRIPYIVTAHAGDVFPLRSKALRWFGKFSLDHADWCTVNSQATKKAVLGVSPVKDISVIPMGVDLASFSPKKRTSAIRNKYHIPGPFLLSVGRLAEKKGLTYLLDALPAVLKKYPAAHLLIVGDGPEKEHLERQAKSLNLTRSVTFTGKIRNDLLPRYYASADLFVGPSIVTKDGDTEGLGVVFLEALASGTAVIGSDVGGIPDIIHDGKTGVLVKEKDPHALADAIIDLLDHPEKRKSMIRQGQAHIRKNYSWDVVADKFDDILSRMAKHKRK